jgi:TRAF3-interacting protein 1
MGEFWQETASMYASVISRPKMTQKLLEKPPFRFLHDVIMATIAATGYGQGLFSEEECDSANIADKNAKIAFLEKVIGQVSTTIGEPLNCKPGKIVAGQEPESTNHFLQALCRAATGQFTKKTEERKPEEDKRGGKEERKKKGEDRKGEERKRKEEEKTRADEKRAAEERRATEAKAAEEEKKKEERRRAEEKKKAEESKAKKEPPRKAKIVKAEDEDEEEPVRVKQTKPERPTTAGRRPPPVKPQAAEEVPVVEETKSKGIKLSNVKAEEHGKLVRNILETEVPKTHKQERTEALDLNAPEEKKIRLGGIRSVKATGGVKPKISAISVEDLTSLKENIQTVCQSTNPLGKSMELINDDIDSMKSEHEKWRKDYSKSATLMEEQRKITEQTLQPLYDRLADVSEQIKDRLQKINHKKAQILKNEETIEHLLSSVVSAK